MQFASICYVSVLFQFGATENEVTGCHGSQVRLRAALCLRTVSSSSLSGAFQEHS